MINGRTEEELTKERENLNDAYHRILKTQEPGKNEARWRRSLKVVHMKSAEVCAKLASVSYDSEKKEDCILEAAVDYDYAAQEAMENNEYSEARGFYIRAIGLCKSEIDDYVNKYKCGRISTIERMLYNLKFELKIVKEESVMYKLGREKGKIGKMLLRIEYKRREEKKEFRKRVRRE